MRKLLTGAVAASATLAIAAGAIAQDPGIQWKSTVKPTKAGTKRNPKNTALTFDMKVDKPGTTVQFIDLALPKRLKFSGKGLGNCTVDDLAFVGPAACADDKAGPQGTADAVFGVQNTPLHFTVQRFVQDSNTLLFYVASAAGEGVQVQSPITGESTGRGRKMRITIPQALRQPAPGQDASLTGLNQTFSAKKGKRYLVSSLGCRAGKHQFSGQLTFAVRADGAAVPPPATATSSARCKKA